MTAVALAHEIDGRADAPAVLLGGSLGTTLSMWEPQLAPLARAWRVVRFDHRGHGGSPVPSAPYTIDELGGDVLALIDALELDRVAYVGLSIGGMVGEWLAVHAPERVSALVLLCTTARMDSPDPWVQRAATVRAAGTVGGIADAVVARWFTDRYAISHPDIVSRCRATISGCDVEGYAGCCEAIAAFDLVDALPGIVAPTLVVAGAQDEAIPPVHSRRIADAIPGARYELLDPAAHIASIERADAVTALIDEHLRAVAT